MQQTCLSGSSFFYSCYLLRNLRWIAITHKVQRHFGPRLQSTITRACAQASKQAYLSIWFSTLLSLGPHLWFCLSQWCHVLGDCGTILQGASKHITTLWRVRHQHDLDLSHFARTSECQAGLYIDYKVLQYVFLSVGMFHHIYIYLKITINLHKSQTPGKLLWLPFWNKLPLPVGIEPLKATCFWMTKKPFDALGSSSNKSFMQKSMERKKTTSSNSSCLAFSTSVLAFATLFVVIETQPWL